MALKQHSDVFIPAFMLFVSFVVIIGVVAGFDIALYSLISTTGAVIALAVVEARNSSGGNS